MKKALWAIGIFIFSLIVTSALFVFNVFLLVFMLYPLTLVSSALTASGMIRLCKKTCGKHGIRALTFWLLAFLPQLIVGAGAAAVIWIGAGRLNTLEMYDLAVTCLTYGVSGAIFTRSAVKKFKEVQQ